MMKRLSWILLPALLLAASCREKTLLPERGYTQDNEKRYANLFACNTMGAYYLWSDEISSALKNWQVGEDPIAKVESLRYKDAYGNLVDQWTELMDDYTPFASTVSGNGKTFGMDFVLYYTDATKTQVSAVVTFTYADSPARKAGLKRGDVILTFDGQSLNADNYASILSEKVFDNATTLRLGLKDGRTLTMTAVSMYSNPVHVVKTLPYGGKTFGYLHFTGFTQEAAIDLVEACRQFKAEGIDELILDLRYNTGGYANTSAVLASMIAPLSAVKAGAVFNKAIYNKNLSEVMDEDECFAESFTIAFDSGKKTLRPGDANMDLAHVWAITTGHSASASEALICGLKPYIDVTLVGSRTYGKFCGGYLITASDWYEALEDADDVPFDASQGKKYTAKWGIYVIASRYADCNGVTLSMPSGIPADYEVDDDPRDGYELGDPSETMLAKVLSVATGSVLAVSKAAEGTPEEVPFTKPGYGALLW